MKVQDYNDINREVWIEKLKTELKDKFSKTFYRNIFENIEIDLTKLKTDFSFDFSSANQDSINGYKINVSNFKDANKFALSLLDSGVQTLWFEIDTTDNDYAILFKEIEVGYIKVFVDFKSDIKRDLSFFDQKEFKTVIVNSKNNTHFIDGSKIKEIGGSNFVQNAYILKLIDNVISMSQKDDIQIIISTGTSGDYFIDISSLLSIRLLVNTVISEYKLENIQLHFVSNISKFNKATKNHERNLLRLTNEVLSSIMGESDVILNSSWIQKESILKESKDMINVIHVLMNECGFKKEEGWMSGSYIIHELCCQLIENTWELFTSIQHLNYDDSTKALLLQIDSNRQKIKKAILENDLVFIGMNKFKDEESIRSNLFIGDKFLDRDFFKYEILANEN